MWYIYHLTTRPNSIFLICSDFNCYHATSLGVDTSLTNHGTSTNDFSDSMRLTRCVNFPTGISPNGKSSILELVITVFHANVSCSPFAIIGSSDHVLVRVNISLAILESWLDACDSGISHKQIGRDCKQPSLFRPGLPYVLPLILNRSGNSSTEICSFSCSD